MIIYVFLAILGGCTFYLLWQLQALKAKIKTISRNIKAITDIVQLPENLKGFEVRQTIATNQVRIDKIEGELPRVEGIALRALDHTSSLIRHNKENPLSNQAIEKFIDENHFPKK